jgi:hypothetical protein
VTSTPAAYNLIQVRSSRLWALVHFSLTRWLFPARMVTDHVGVSTSVIRFWLTPWQRTDEHLPMSHIAEVTHSRGLIWDQISVESSGGLNPLVIPGLPKGQACYFVERIRERLNETGAVPLEQPLWHPKNKLRPSRGPMPSYRGIPARDLA